jgi:hypothetical protein
MSSQARSKKVQPASKYSAIRANPAPARPTEAITLCDGRHGTGVWPESRERPRPARTSAPLTPGTWAPQERGRSLAGTYNLGGWFTAAGGPSAQRGPDAGRAPGRVRSAAAAVRVTGGHQGGDDALAV